MIRYSARVHFPVTLLVAALLYDGWITVSHVRPVHATGPILLFLHALTVFRLTKPDKLEEAGIIDAPTDSKKIRINYGTKPA